MFFSRSRFKHNRQEPTEQTSFPLVSETRPTSIYFRPGQGLSIERLSIEEALEKFDMQQWTHTLWDYTKEKLSPKDQRALTKLINDSIATEEKMFIAPMREPFPGYGAFARETIPEGSIIVYSGHKSETSPDDSYVAGSSINSDIVTSRYYGNMARFLNHAFTTEKFNEHIELHSETEFSVDSLIMANFIPRGKKIGNTIFSILVASRDISPEEPLCWNYGAQYFERETLSSPYLLTKTGTVVPQDCFHWKSPMVVFHDPQGDHIQPVSVRSLVEDQGILSFKPDSSSYHTVIYYTYFTHDPSFNARIPHQLHNFIPRPTEPSPDVKFTTEQQMEQLSSSVSDSVLIRELLKAEYNEDEWRKVEITQKELVIRPEKSTFFIFIGNEQRKDIILRELKEARVSEEDIKINHKGEILLSKRGVFSAVPNCKAYNLKQVSSIYKPQEPFKWSGNEKWPSPSYIWLELGSAKEDLDLLSKLAKHIKLFLVTDREKSAILISKNATNGNYILMIKDASVISRNKISPFQIAVASLGAAAEKDEEEVIDERQTRLTA